MLKLKYITLLIFSVLIIFACCKKKKNEPTPNADDIVSAKIDGVYFQNCQPSSWGHPSLGAQYFVGYYLDIDGQNICSNTSNYGLGIYLKINGINQTGTYLLGDSSINVGLCYDNNTSPATKYTTDSIHKGSVTFTKFDTTARRISGTFYFDAIDTATKKVVKVTEGKLSNVEYLKF